MTEKKLPEEEIGNMLNKTWNTTHKKPEHKFEANCWVWCVDFEVVNKEGYET